MVNEKRLIDANVLKELILRRSGNMQHSWTSPAVLLAVECQPTVDAVEVVHGRWIRIGGNRYTIVSQCSNCCAKYDFMSNYCPNCGAKMDGDGNG